MPGSARRVRAAYSRTLCLPCLKAGFFCFLHYRYRPLNVQLFIFNFLCICFSLFGTSFSAVPLSNPFFRWLLPVPYKPQQEPHAGPTGLVCSFGGVVPLPGLQNCTQGRTGPGLISPQNELTPPPKGGGAGYHLGWVRPARSQPGYAGPTGPVWGFAGVVPLPGLQNRTQGHTGPSLDFTVFSWGALGLVALPNLVPA